MLKLVLSKVQLGSKSAVVFGVIFSLLFKGYICIIFIFMGFIVFLGGAPLCCYWWEWRLTPSRALPCLDWRPRRCRPASTWPFSPCVIFYCSSTDVVAPGWVHQKSQEQLIQVADPETSEGVCQKHKNKPPPSVAAFTYLLRERYFLWPAKQNKGFFRAIFLDLFLRIIVRGFFKCWFYFILLSS